MVGIKPRLKGKLRFTASWEENAQIRLSLPAPKQVDDIVSTAMKSDSPNGISPLKNEISQDLSFSSHNLRDR